MLCFDKKILFLCIYKTFGQSDIFRFLSVDIWGWTYGTAEVQNLVLKTGCIETTSSGDIFKPSHCLHQKLFGVGREELGSSSWSQPASSALLPNLEIHVWVHSTGNKQDIFQRRVIVLIKLLTKHKSLFFYKYSLNVKMTEVVHSELLKYFCFGHVFQEDLWNSCFY